MPPLPYSDHSLGENSLDVAEPFSENCSLLHQLPAATSLQQETTVKPKKVHLTKELKFCSEVLKELITVDRRDCASSFFESANVWFDVAANSDEVIESPMDLVTIKKKLENGEYKTANEFAADVRLIFSNSYKFYGQGCSISPAAYSYAIRVQMARKLQNVFEMEFAKMPDTFPESDDDCEESENESGHLQQIPQQTEATTHQASMSQPLGAAQPPLIPNIVTKLGSLNLDAKMPRETNLSCAASKSSSGTGNGYEGVRACLKHNMLKAQQTLQQVLQQFQASTHETDMTEYHEESEEQIQIHLPDAKMPRETNRFCVSSDSNGGFGRKEGGEARFGGKETLQQFPSLYIPLATRRNASEVPQEFKAPTLDIDKRKSANSELQNEFETYFRNLQKFFGGDKMPRETNKDCASSKSSNDIVDSKEGSKGRLRAQQTQQQVQELPHPIFFTQSSNAEQPNSQDGPINFVCSDAKMPRVTDTFDVYYDFKSSSGTGDSREGSEPQLQPRKTQQHLAPQFQAPTHMTDAYEKYLQSIKQKNEYEGKIKKALQKYFRDLRNSKISEEQLRAQSIQQVSAPSHPIRMNQTVHPGQPNLYKDLDNHPDAKIPKETDTFDVYYNFKSSSGTGDSREGSKPQLQTQKTQQHLAPQFQAPTHMTDTKTYEKYLQSIKQKNGYEGKIRKAHQKHDWCPRTSEMSEELLRAQSTQQQVPAPSHPIWMTRFAHAEQPNPYKNLDNHPLPLTSHLTEFNSSNTFIPFAGTSSFPRAYTLARPSRELEERASAIFHKHVVRMVMRRVYAKTGRFPETLEHLCDEILMYEGVKPNPAAESSNNKLCKFCTVNDISTVFQPCGHSIACKECAMYYGTSYCVVCCKKIDALSFNRNVC